ncbi:MAG: UTP--glucose-1-phosphate uridylyltransferase GalU [Rhodocyclaceae bacterium]|jgi:UTP--glucose-1-phosphate uridylyltransferase|nr:UTP--glucose-1-phosphate uridylyltransferase GalU [Rhodocyclaceae bacterium]MCE2981786.1 UTP--glucose-1-phosphate uridylyltransferase GalU [Betaproteobacteria bacterium]MCA3090331.1 UTP--glucose-1-phosphate uridylyltransferase GalU [Rhodocyclaceae bacterium]MCA3098970.1 UTP--glucose-1-phosphate uridylyltransferase GalU [Rhodocyclaceae bacterium]MCA3104141.1 UTP--glucose-1-phosphate uridylyltransferase GalU [Rhodocyclaceae bacterium]
MKREITKAVFPVAGMGSRFLPATKASPKEMLPVVDKPLIQYAVEEAVAAGMTEMIFVTGRNKRAIEDHFDKAAELEAALEERGNQKLLATVRGILPAGVHCVFIRQPETLGLGHAVLCARPLVGDEPFAVILADDLIDAKPSVMTQMVERYSYYRRSVIGVQNVAREETDQYGIVRCGSILNDVHQIDGIVEKPTPAEAPSTLGVVGRYILSPRIFDHLANAQPGKGGEIQLTDAIASLLKQEQVLAYQFQGTRYDCGSKIGYLKATIAFAMSHPDVSEEFIAHLRGVAATLPTIERGRAAA